jgi:aspartate/methionine/tyrosine aminotransferase
MEIAGRCQRIAPFHVMALLERAQALQAAGHDVVHLEVGEPDFPTPEAVLAAGRQALDAGATRYTPAAGIPELRQAISDYYRDRFAVDVPAGRILVTPGASGALQLALAALVNPGDGVLITDPGYPCNRHFVELLNGRPQPLSLDAGTGFAVSAGQLEAAWQSNTVAAMLASPDNPTGNVISETVLAEVARVVQARGGALLMDEIYQGLNFAGAPHTVLSVMPGALVLNSFSKFFGMTGWRLGWLVAPEPLVEPVTRMAQNFFLAPSTPAQHAALAAFHPETMMELERRRQELDRRRRLLLERLPETGLRVVGEPQGAFYLYVDVSAVCDDAFGFCERLLDEEKVALTPGLDFGAHHEPGRYLRIAYTTDCDRLDQALTRIRRFMERQ